MTILLYRYGNICEPDILSLFKEAGLTVLEECTEITNKKISPGERLRLINKILLENKVTFVFSINFFPSISDLCQKLQILYVCWSVDCPVLELYSKSVGNSNNRIFLFDYHQYESVAPLNPSCVFYLPLATNVERWDSVISTITADDISRYSCDVSLVGSLYTEKSPLSSRPLRDALQGYVDGIIEAQLKVYGYNFLEELTTPALIDEIKRNFGNFPTIASPAFPLDQYTVANYYLGMLVSERERIYLLNTLSDFAAISLFTRSNTSYLNKNIMVKGGISTLTEMPKVFHLSKINLNITMRPIQTGLSLRVWDIIGCGGFLMTNYQAELPEYFEIDKEIVCFESTQDLLEKVKFYLEHDDIRREIAYNGYEKVKARHTYAHRISAMFKILEEEWMSP